MSKSIVSSVLVSYMAWLAAIELPTWVRYLTFYIFLGLPTWLGFFWLCFLLYFSGTLPLSFLRFPQGALLCPSCLHVLHLFVPLEYLFLPLGGITKMNSFLLFFLGLSLFLNSKGGSKTSKLVPPLTYMDLKLDE